MATYRIACVLAALLFALAAFPGSAAAVKSGSPRKVPVDMIVIHSTGGPGCDGAGRPIWAPGGSFAANLRVIEAHPKLGIHYMIGRDGRIAASVPEDRVAHHVFRYSGRSIGIELVNDGDGVDPFPPAQVDALVGLLAQLVQRYGIARDGVKRHSDLDHGRMACAPERPRKVDPGRAFPFGDVLRRVYDSR